MADARYTWAIQATKAKYTTGFNPLETLDAGPLTNGASDRITHVYGKELSQDQTWIGLSGVHGPALGVAVEKQPAWCIGSPNYKGSMPLSWP